MVDMMPINPFFFFFFFGVAKCHLVRFLVIFKLRNFNMIYFLLRSFELQNFFFKNGHFTLGIESSKFQGRNFYKDGRV
jgi:hypothetical protein